MKPLNNNDEGTGIGTEDLLNTLIAALQGLKARPQVPRSQSPAEESGSWIQNRAASFSPTSPSRGRKGGWAGHGGCHLQNQETEAPEEPEVEDTEEDAEEDEEAVFLDVRGEIKVINIQSPHLVRALHKVNEHPSPRKQSQTITLVEPFPSLFDHLEDVREEVGQLDNPKAQADLKALELAVEETDVARRWNAARAELDLDSSVVRFDTLWRLFRPGDLVVHADALGNEWLLTLTEVEEYRKRFESDETDEIAMQHYIEFWTWGLSWNGHKNKLERKIAAFRIHHFVGEREIHLLPVYPVRYQRVHGSVEKFLQSLAARGRKWFELASARTSCLEYDGPAFGQIVTSIDGLNKKAIDPRADVMHIKKNMVVVTKKSKELATNCIKSMGPFRDGREWDPAELDAREQYQWNDLPATKVLTDDEARLCVPLVGCYSVENKEFYLVSAEKLRPVPWDPDAMKRLVLDEEKKALLEGLVSQHYSKEQDGHQRDFIPKKGEGLVVLLHGPPGVGKTLTAESLAQQMKKPLVSLSVGNLIWDEWKLQERLVAEFSRAIDWDAILLLDEADVVLEERSFEDVRRNAIVSVFLRELEYYRGVLFLTTNRISNMDTAFQSRIQIGIGFKDLMPADRKKIWLNLLNLNKDSHKDRHALEQIIENADKLAKWELNGREIRNVLNIADACARRRPATGWMTYEDVDKAARATLEFKNVLETERSNLKTEQTVWTPYSRGLL
ncbi:P-loop containing nucleoside triphosphate hydrolase protein [Chaetomium sp. MPI-CAGE-AT-0009]|nr:P-loop containing nucleoside triphosphate hydrolase protein [Chaetomium sp. MPI-CAGE-AT-0009]